MKKRLLVFSADALVREDVDYLMTLPNFGNVMKESCRINKVRTIYPSLTYPVHVSISTGCYAGKHGIVNNCDFTTGDAEDTWIWYHDRIKVDDIFTLAKKHGYTTGSVFWPVTSNHPYIDYHVPEYWLPLPTDSLEGSFRRLGSSDNVVGIIKSNSHFLDPNYVKTGKKNFTREPDADNFIIGCSCDIIKKYAPEVMFIHNWIVDSARHKFGVFNSEVTKAVKEVDGQFGKLVQALKEAGVYDDTNIVVLSDHGQMDVKRVVETNVFLADRGLIDVDDQGNVVDFKAFCFSGGLCSQVYLKDPRDSKIYNQVYTILKEMADEGIYGFSKVFSREEVNVTEHLYGDFSFVLETDGFSSFGDACSRPVVRLYNTDDYRFGRATHGYLPDKGPQPVFHATGPDFVKNKILERAPIVDEGPTFAKLLGFSMPDADGKPINDFLTSV